MFLASGEPEKDTVSAMTVCRVDVMGSDLGSGIWDLGSGIWDLGSQRKVLEMTVCREDGWASGNFND